MVWCAYPTRGLLARTWLNMMWDSEARREDSVAGVLRQVVADEEAQWPVSDG